MDNGTRCAHRRLSLLDCQGETTQVSDTVTHAAMLSRAQGCLLGQLVGDALGSMVEFQDPATIRLNYPQGVREMADGGAWNTIAGQPTDDSEMALALARLLVNTGEYSQELARAAYADWLATDPFDCGMTVMTGLSGRPNQTSQANGALMRISPLGVFGASVPAELVAKWARQDAEITHPNPLCQDANALFVMAIRHAIRTGCKPSELYECVLRWAEEQTTQDVLICAIRSAADRRPADYLRQQGWVVTAFHNALWQLLHAPSLEEAVVDTVMQGGDTDTNAAICGALLGALYGVEAIPRGWTECVLHCRPETGRPNVRHPRPACFWPVDALELAKQLMLAGLALQESAGRRP